VETDITLVLLNSFNPLAGESFGKESEIGGSIVSYTCFNPLAGESFGKGHFMFCLRRKR